LFTISGGLLDFLGNPITWIGAVPTSIYSLPFLPYGLGFIAHMSYVDNCLIVPVLRILRPLGSLLLNFLARSLTILQMTCSSAMGHKHRLLERRGSFRDNGPYYVVSSVTVWSLPRPILSESGSWSLRSNALLRHPFSKYSLGALCEHFISEAEFISEKSDAAAHIQTSRVSSWTQAY
jgi:hypothetical protein